MIFHRLVAVLCMLGIVVTASGVAVAEGDALQAKVDDRSVLLVVKRGLNAQLTFSHPDPALRALPDQSRDAEVLVRLERSAASSASDGAGYDYTLSFFGAVAGEYDLSKWVVKRDGSPLSAAEALSSQWVRVVSELPPGQGTSLYEIADPTVKAPRGYRAAFAALAIVWALVPVVWGVFRWRSRRPEPEPVVIAAPTLADRLRPLIQKASAGQLTVAEQGRLELLLYVFWQRRLALPEPLAEALPMMRRDATAGQLLRTLEAWVHADAAARPELNAATLDALLEPYHAYSAEALDEADEAGAVRSGVAS